MKIVHLVRRYYPYIGGVETHVKKVSEELVKLGHTVTIITQQLNNEPLQEKQAAITIYRIPQSCGNSKSEMWQWFVQHKQLLTSQDIIQVHDVFWWIFPVYFNIKSKVFTTFHGWEGIYPVPNKNKLVRLISAQLSQKTLHIGAWIQEFYWDKPTLINYGGGKTIVSNNTDKSKSNKIKIVFVGRLDQDNDIEKYIELINLLKSKNNIEITWVGDGEYRSQCEKYGEVTGFVTDVESYIQAANIIFASSYLSIIQAQHNHKLVCSFYSNNLKKRYLETYPLSKYTLYSDSTNELHIKIEKILKNKKEITELLEAQSKDIQTFTWKTVTKVYLKLWNIHE